MLRFFGQIRQKLFQENRFYRYLFYALGEIALVVIGILIALQINNWNEGNKALKKEELILREIHAEFRINLAKLDTINQRYSQTEIALSRLLMAMKAESKWSFQGEVLDSLLLFCSGHHPWPRSNVTLRVLENSGQLENLNNDRLKKLLYTWIGEIENIKVTEDMTRRAHYAYASHIMEYGSWREIDKEGLARKEGGSSLMPNNDHLLKDFRFENVVDDYLVLIRIQKFEYAELRELMKEIIEVTRFQKSL